jgi:hypothetical protein
MGGNPDFVARNIAAVCDKRQKNGFLMLADQSKYLSDRQKTQNSGRKDTA